MSPFWILFELKVMEVVVTTEAIRCAKLQLESHHQQTNTQFLQGGCHSCRPTNSVKALKGKVTNSSTNDNTNNYNNTCIVAYSHDCMQGARHSYTSLRVSNR